MLVGFENWPAPEPGMPAWQLAVQTSLCAAPSVTPHPQAARKLPLASNFCTRALPLSATYTTPFVGATATPTGVWNWPAPEPWLPNVDRGTRTACAVAAPSASVEAQMASASTIPLLALPPAGDLIEILLCPVARPGAADEIKVFSKREIDIGKSCPIQLYRSTIATPAPPGTGVTSCHQVTQFPCAALQRHLVAPGSVGDHARRAAR